MERNTATALWKNTLVIFVGFFWGVMMATYLETQFDPEKAAGQQALLWCLWAGAGCFGSILFLEMRKKIRGIVNRLTLNENTRQLFFKYHSFTYVIFLSYGLVLAGLRPYFSFVLFLLVIFALLQLLLLGLVSDRPQKERWYSSLDTVPVLFFISGFAALIYQVVWQRVLFATFGSNIESVTVIVSVFMFGLGVGALAGGQLQKYFPKRALECFIAIEIAIGVFGICSIPLIHAIGGIVPHNSLLSLILVTYALLGLPTMLMGSTLPVLVGHLRRHYATLGGVVAKLYACNTLGSAFASFLTVMLLFTMMGQQATLIIAALCNAATAWMVFVLFSKAPRIAAVPEPVLITPDGSAISYSWRAIMFFSGVIGYISLSLEILWFRIIGFMTANMPQVFGTLLAVFLTGIAMGSLKAKRWSESGRSPIDFIRRGLTGMALVTYFSVPVAGWIGAYGNKQLGELSGYIAVLLLAWFSGGIFPMLFEMIALKSQKNAGNDSLSVSWIYFANILGATLGSLVTGFVLFDRFTLEWNIIIISGIILLFLCLFQRKMSLSSWLTGLCCVALAFAFRPALYDNIIGKLMAWPPGLAVPRFVNENRHGIILTARDKGGDRIYGNGAYDGRFNIDPAVDSNKITRIYLLAALHPHPQRILEMGMSAGSATKVLTLYQPLQSLTTVEIDPGYAWMNRHYPQIASAMDSPKMTLVIDDGRRWLANHPDEKFDVITMNTIYYWRNNATNLLSREFLTLCKKHLNPGGIVYYNTTEAEDSVYTAAHVFDHVTTYINFVAASDAPFAMSYEERKANLMKFAGDDGKPVFAGQEQVMERLAGAPLKDIRTQMLQKKDLWLITDDNMASEYKIEHSFMPPHFPAPLAPRTARDAWTQGPDGADTTAR